MITGAAARLMKLTDYGVAVGNPADLVVLPCRDTAAAVMELVQPLMGFKGGRKSFTRQPTMLLGPGTRPSKGGRYLVAPMACVLRPVPRQHLPDRLS